MFRFRYSLALLMIVVIIIAASSVMASTDKEFFSVSEGHEIIKDVEAYASNLNIDLDTAAHQLALQELAGYLDAELSRRESQTFAGLWIQHSPQFQIIAQFTKEGNEIIRPYIENETLSGYIKTRIVKYTIKELQDAQVATQYNIRNLDIPTNSGINLIENKVEVYVVEGSQFEFAMKEINLQLPPQVEVVIVTELSKQETDIFAGLALSDCTSGFSVINSSGIKGILTAAHCPNTISYNGIDLPFQASAYGGPYDFQWHTAPGLNVRNLAFDGTNNRYIFSTKHRDNQTVGEWVCKHGAATGYTCGFIIDKNFNPGGAMDSTLIRVHNTGVNLSEDGDSGGPWFSLNTAYGLHVGGIGDDAYYMAINFIDFLGLSVLTNNTAFLPLVVKNLTQSLNLINPIYDNGYSTPTQSTSNPESSPYP